MNHVLLEPGASTATLLLNRPDKRNALTLDMWAAIPPLLEKAAADKSVRSLIVRGAGGAFAAGADIAEFAETYDTREKTAQSQAVMSAAMRALEEFPKPTIALIEGACVGAGCGVALCCDLRFTAPDAKLGVTPAKLGVMYSLPDTRRLVQAVGFSTAKDILFTGRLLDAQEALRVGLVDRVAENVEAETTTFTQMLAANSQFTLQAMKRTLRMIRDGAREETPESLALFADSFAGEDFREGFSAFMEKRPPRFPWS